MIGFTGPNTYVIFEAEICPVGRVQKLTLDFILHAGH
jgi:hypothetical protein